MDRTHQASEEEASRVELSIECDRNILGRVNEAWSAFATELKIVTLRRVTVQRDLVCSRRHTFLVPGEMPIASKRVSPGTRDAPGAVM